MLTYVDEAGQDEAAYERITWEYGERPAWWKQARLIWNFCSSVEGDGFATSDLEVAAARLFEDHPVERLAIVWRELFLLVPRGLGQEVRLPTFDLTVEALAVAPFARRQIARLRALQAEASRLEAALKELVVTSAQDMALTLGEGADSFIFDESFPDTYYGLTPAEMLAWAKGTSSYDLEDACHRYAVEAKEQAREAREQRQQDERVRSELRAFLDRMSKSYFEPETPEEEQALALHRRSREYIGNESAVDRYAGERDAYIIEHILKETHD